MANQVLVYRAGGVAEIVINRPEKLNAMTPAMIAQLASIAADVDRDEAVKVVLLRGEGEGLRHARGNG